MQLQELWAMAFPETPFTTLKSNKWKDMGWQVGVWADCRVVSEHSTRGADTHLHAVTACGKSGRSWAY